MEKMLGVLYTLPQSAWVFQDRMLGVCNKEASVCCCRTANDRANDEFWNHSLQLIMRGFGYNTLALPTH